MLANNISLIEKKRLLRAARQNELHRKKKRTIDEIATLLLTEQQKQEDTLSMLRNIREIFEKKFPEMIGEDNGYRFRRTVEFHGIRKSIWVTPDRSKNYELFLEACGNQKIKKNLKIKKEIVLNFDKSVALKAVAEMFSHPKNINQWNPYNEEETKKAVDSILHDFEHCEFNHDFAHAYVDINELHIPSAEEIEAEFQNHFPSHGIDAVIAAQEIAFRSLPLPGMEMELDEHARELEKFFARYDPFTKPFEQESSSDTGIQSGQSSSHVYKDSLMHKGQLFTISNLLKQ